jgi:hypothetical protein
VVVHVLLLIHVAGVHLVLQCAVLCIAGESCWYHCHTIAEHAVDRVMLLEQWRQM